MKLDKCTIRPGIVLEVLEHGAIKASAQGLFSFNEDPSLLPPIQPFFIGSNSNIYSKPAVYDDVWIMNFLDNPQQLYWFRKDKLSSNENIPFEDNIVEVICNKENGADWATLYFSDGSGWVIGNGDSIVQIKKDGSILLDTGMPSRKIDINGENISIGSIGKSAHPAAYGDAVVSVINSLCVMLNSIGMKAMANPYTIAIGTELLAKLPSITSKLADVPSQNVTID